MKSWDKWAFKLFLIVSCVLILMTLFRFFSTKDDLISKHLKAWAGNDPAKISQLEAYKKNCLTKKFENSSINLYECAELNGSKEIAAIIKEYDL